MSEREATSVNTAAHYTKLICSQLYVREFRFCTNLARIVYFPGIQRSRYMYPGNEKFQPNRFVPYIETHERTYAIITGLCYIHSTYKKKCCEKIALHIKKRFVDWS